MSLSCLFVGFGQISSKVLSSLQSNAGIDMHADVFKRSPFSDASPMVGRCFNGDVANSATWRDIPKSYDLLVYCLTPAGRNADDYHDVFVTGLSNCIAHFEGAHKPSYKPPHILFISSTSVYAQDDASWVDEGADTLGHSPTSKVLVEAERLLEKSLIPATIVRFSGIYGGTRTRLIQQVQEGLKVLSVQQRLSNRIHEIDAVGFVAHLIARYAQGRALLDVYNATDSAPSDLNDVYRVIADALGLELNAALASGTVARRTGNKRISNQRMLETGYVLAYPTFREGYAQMCRDFAQIDRG